jgi:hypothetical protein
MHNGRAGKIPETHGLQPAAAPYPVTGKRIHQRNKDERENEERMKLDPFRHGARDDRRGCSGEDELEQEFGPEGYFCPAERVKTLIDSAVCEEDIGKADEWVTVSEHQAPADNPKGNGSYGEYGEVFGKNVYGVFAPAEA